MVITPEKLFYLFLNKIQNDHFPEIIVIIYIQHLLLHTPLLEPNLTAGTNITHFT